jgi:mRNA interferase RelE/StbE
VTWQVLWEPAALNAATGHLAKDPAGVDALLQATDQLAENPKPPGSPPWGTDHRRLRHGPWRVLYRLDSEARVVHIEHFGRVVGP